ncbi:odorant receptor 13a isoform X2 [Ooceraea biroi]|uniref:odorant receptor 13a isoform X2 n=1 Tax=Ooceraea biroi TaxID=2015173 RepID=UPI000F07DBBD|nr:odorant receptor 13a isoform X2 [Ooceraea biroi]
MKVTSTIGRSVEIPLRMFGIWPGSPYVSLCRLFWTIALVTAQYFQYQYIITHIYIADLSDLMDGLSATLAFTLLFIKLVTFWINQRTFNKILAMMAIDWKKNSGIDFNMIISNATLSHNFSNFVFSFHSIAVIVYSISVLTVSTSDYEGTDISMRPLILKMNFPFHSDTQLIYAIMLIAQFLYLLLCSIGVSTLNALLIVLILHLAGQIDILRRWLTEILFSEENGYKPSAVMIKKIIEKHQNIINFSEDIENLYSRIALILFVSDTLIICFVGFVLVTSIGASNSFFTILKILAFYFVMNFEAFVYCFAGEYLSSKFFICRAK